MTDFHYLVLAAQRTGVVNPLAVAAGVSHKCIMPLRGRPLISYVLSALKDTPNVAQISVSIDDPDALEGVTEVEELRAAGKLSILQSGTTLTDSVFKALEDNKAFPCIITTADNVLATPDMFTHFATHTVGADVAVGLTPKEVLQSKYPDGQKRFHRFKDGEYSNCNMYAILTPKALKAAEIFRTGGQFAKAKSRFIKAFGLLNTVGHLNRMFTRDRAFERIGKRLGVKAIAVDMPFPEAPIDVDDADYARMAEDILSERESARDRI